MSTTIETPTLGELPAPGVSYTVEDLHGCKVVYGPVPVSDLIAFSSRFSKKAVIHAGLADRMGATFVMGEPADIDALRQRDDLPVSAAREADAKLALNLSNDGLVNWLRTGERGQSANAMCQQFFGIPAGLERRNHPRDADDARRCLLFLDASGSVNRLSEMASVSPEWACLAKAWPEITQAWCDADIGRVNSLVSEAIRQVQQSEARTSS